jgi:branched-chain amino acid transport system substrate-binding protein
MGWNISMDEMVAGTVADWTPILSKIRADPPAIIVNWDWNPANAILFMKQFLESPTPSLVFLAFAPSYPTFVEAAKTVNCDGVLWNYSIARFMIVDEGIKFSDEYEKTYGNRPGPIGVEAHDSIYIIKQMAENAGSWDKEALADAFPNIDYKGYLGRYVMDPETHFCKVGEGFLPFTGFQIRNSPKSVCIDPPALVQGEFEIPPWYEEALKKY